MRVVRESSIDEYARWYLRREGRKCPAASIDDAGNPVGVMRRKHAGKMRDWFGENTQWHIVSLDAMTDLANLVFLECKWTIDEGLVVRDGKNYRLLWRVAENAIALNYLQRSTAKKHKDYYERLKAGSLRLEGDERIAICSAEESEISCNPDAQYYLLDGAGRCLPYMVLVAEHEQQFAPIEAFLAAR